MRGKPPALILAGGMSSRMGFDKTHAVLKGRPLHAHVKDCLAHQVSKIVINSNDPQSSSHFQQTPVVADTIGQSFGPLSGIIRGMDYFSQEPDGYFLTASVDCPFLPNDLVEKLSAAIERKQDIAIARSNGRDHPTIALWPVKMRDTLGVWLAQTQRYSVMAFLDTCTVRKVEFPNTFAGHQEIDPFFNINNLQDLQRAQELIDQK